MVDLRQLRVCCGSFMHCIAMAASHEDVSTEIKADELSGLAPMTPPETPKNQSGSRVQKVRVSLTDWYQDADEDGDEADPGSPERKRSMSPTKRCKLSPSMESTTGFFIGDQHTPEHDERQLGTNLTATQLQAAVKSLCSEFCASQAASLRESTRQQCIDFFEAQNLGLSTAMRSFCEDYVKTNVLPEVQKLQESQVELRAEMEDLRNQLQSLSAKTPQLHSLTEELARVAGGLQAIEATASEIKTSGGAVDSQAPEADSDSLLKDRKQLKQKKRGVSPRKARYADLSQIGQLVFSPRKAHGGKIDLTEEACKSPADSSQMQLDIRDIREELKDSLAWRMLGTASERERDNMSDAGSNAGSITSIAGSIASIASAAFDSQFSQSMRNVRERLHQRRQRKLTQATDTAEPGIVEEEPVPAKTAD